MRVFLRAFIALLTISFYAAWIARPYDGRRPMSALPSVDVLVVEDNRLVSELLLHALRSAGLTTDVAGNVVEAKRLLARGSYRVLVLDLILPDGRGSDVLDFIKSERLPPMHIMVITAADPAYLTGIDRSIVKSVMFKPIDPEHFIGIVRAMALDRTSHRS
jgi:DNA-binding response OmpR family regulator